MDFLTSIPVSNVLAAVYADDGAGEALRLARLLRIARTARMFKLLRLFKLMRVLNKFGRAHQCV